MVWTNDILKAANQYHTDGASASRIKWNQNFHIRQKDDTTSRMVVKWDTSERLIIFRADGEEGMSMFRKKQEGNFPLHHLPNIRKPQRLIQREKTTVSVSLHQKKFITTVWLNNMVATMYWDSTATKDTHLIAISTSNQKICSLNAIFIGRTENIHTTAIPQRIRTKSKCGKKESIKANFIERRFMYGLN